MPEMFRRAKWLLLPAGLVLCGALAWLLWQPSPRSEQKFDRGLNGVWVGHQWYSGRKVRSGDAIGPGERQRFVNSLQRHHIKWVYVHAGPLNEDGTISDAPTAFSAQLRRETPELEWIPWLGGDIRRLRLT